LLIALLPLVGGCFAGFGPKARNGITFYCPGAGNVDLGDAGLREGLEKAGYRGEVARLMWTVTFNPVVDQLLRVDAYVGALKLSGLIQDYVDLYPEREVNVVGLSAGTGVAVWALEHMKPGCKVNTVVLLSSSLSSDFDVHKALQHIQGKIYCYYSPNDAVLAGPMKLSGTIDGRFLVDGAGAVGLYPPRAEDRERVVNIPWRPEFERYGYFGGHLDSTSPEFVQRYVSKHLVSPVTEKPSERVTASRQPTTPPGVPLD
jgi:pimeloyl-ACP methyl ester carboxylesterase